MKYMLLIQGNTEEWAAFDTWPEEDVQAMHRFMNTLNDDIRQAGEWVDANGLTGPANLKTVRTQPGGDALVTDGPYPESKEVLAGYWIVDVGSPERAIELAKRISASPGLGGKPSNQKVEVHPVGSGPVIAD